MAEYRRKGSIATATAPAVAPVPSAPPVAAASPITLFGLGKPRQPPPAKLKVKNGELMVFFRQLAVILQTGVPLSQGLELLAENITNAQFAEFVEVTGELQLVDGGIDLLAQLAFKRHGKPIVLQFEH